MTTAKSSAPEPLSPHAILELASAFQKIRVLLTAYELDLFTALGDGSKTSS